MVKLADKKQCTGCSACNDVCPKNAISMEYDTEGFRYPVINFEKCIKCHLCERKCPALNLKDIERPYIKTYAGYSDKHDVLMNTTSGGVATELSEMVLKDGGVVAGVKYSPDFIYSQYSLADDFTGINNFRGSKYVQSEKNGIFLEIKKLLEDGKKVLFVGCPCDVAGLIEVVGTSNLENLLTCELVCMGVSSPRIAEDFIKYIKDKYKSNITYMCARSKCKGWFVPTLKICLENGRTIEQPLFGSFFGRGFQVYNRPSCFNCKYRGANGIGDIRIGDFWGIKKTDEYWNKNGVSCIFVRTEKGNQAIATLRNAGFKLFEVDYSVATQNNMSSSFNKGEKYEHLCNRFAKIFLQHGLIAACNETADWGFKIKRIVPAALQPWLKRAYHLLRDK